jgi:alginate O-acetyltransferase complex protein AlgI
MIFSSPVFIFGFLPLFLAAYYAVPPRWRNLLIAAASLVFYGWWKAAYMVLLLAIAAVTYAAGWAARPSAAPPAVRLWALRFGVAANLCLLGYFKYAYFLTETFSRVTAAATGHEAFLPLPEILLPIGISFLVFQSISYIVDVARSDAPPARNAVDFLAFSVLFPQLIAGPILRYKDLAAQLSDRRHSLAGFCTGLQRFITGLAMKLLIADSIATLADRLFALPAPTAAEGWLAALTYAVQLFFDFAGYSAMAIGLGLMIGFRFVENFDAPYTARSITGFWKRWHISLSNWLRDYLYIPLGGNRGGLPRTCRNLVLTMVLGGLWHGANWTFVLWGLWHGGLMAMERAAGRGKPGLPPAIAWLLTMVLVLLGWVMFRAVSVTQAVQIYAGMAGLNGLALSPETLILLRPTEVLFLLLGLAVLARDFSAQRDLPAVLPRTAALFSFARPLLLLGGCFIALQARSHSPFLYFQF